MRRFNIRIVVIDRRRCLINTLAILLIIFLALVVLVVLSLLIWIGVQRVIQTDSQEDQTNQYKPSHNHFTVYPDDAVSQQIRDASPSDIAAEAFENNPSHAQSNSALAHQSYQNPTVAQEQERLLYEQHQDQVRQSDEWTQQQTNQQMNDIFMNQL